MATNAAAAKTAKPKVPKAPLSPAAAAARAVTRLGLESAAHALLCVPLGYDDLRTINHQIPVEDDEYGRLYRLTFTGEMTGFDQNKNVLDLEQNWAWPNIRRLVVNFEDAYGHPVSMSVFSSPYPWRRLVPGEVLDMVARVEYFPPNARNPRATLVDVVRPPAHAVGKIWTRYGGKHGNVAADVVDQLVRSQMADPDSWRASVSKLTGETGLRGSDALAKIGVDSMIPDFDALLRALHSPPTVEVGFLAKAVTHEVSVMGIHASALRHNLRPTHAKSPLPISMADIDRLAATQSETLTEDQASVAKGIAGRLMDPTPLNGLLSGDVGTGKTLAYLLPLIAAHQAGAKVAIMAPTEILADQIAMQILRRFEGQVTGVERVGPKTPINDPQSIIVGTPGLPTVAKKAKYTPDILLCDEQHKLSTKARESMVKPWTHYLEVSATPVPRSLASAKFGGKDIFNLRMCPVDKTFVNHLGDINDRQQFSKMLRWAVAEGKRAAVVYPRVSTPKPKAAGAKKVEDGTPEGELPFGSPEEQEDVQATAMSVISGAQALEKVFPGKVVAVHGGLTSAEISFAIEQIKSGQKQVIVASTVIETGVDIPDMTVMIVRDADRFGISQLHQLRGRIARNGGVGHFGMMVEDLGKLPESTAARLTAIKDTTDGYTLAERDLEIRGFGVLDGESQSGAANTVFKLIDIAPATMMGKTSVFSHAERMQMEYVDGGAAKEDENPKPAPKPAPAPQLPPSLRRATVAGNGTPPGQPQRREIPFSLGTSVNAAAAARRTAAAFAAGSGQGARPAAPPPPSPPLRKLGNQGGNPFLKPGSQQATSQQGPAQESEEEEPENQYVQMRLLG